MESSLSKKSEICPDFQITSNLVPVVDEPSLNSNMSIIETQQQVPGGGSASIQDENAEEPVLSPLALSLFIATACLLVIARQLVKESSFNKLPGPIGIWPLGIALQLWSPSERLNVMTAWAQKYKPCCAFKIGTLKFVLLTSVSSAQKLLSSSDSGHLNKGTFYKVFTPIWRDGIGLSNVEKWKERRRLLGRAFTVRSFIGYTQVFNKQSRALVKELAELFEDPDGNPSTSGRRGKPIYEILKQCTLRVICESTMGTDIWGLEGSDKLSYSFSTSEDLCMMRILQPWLLNDWLWSLHPKSKLLREVADMFDQFTYRVIAQRKQKMASAKHADDKEGEPDTATGMKKVFTSIIEEMIMAGIDDEGLVEEVNTFVAAGYESTATTLQFLLFCLAINPKHQEICREEVDRVFDDVSMCPDGDLLYESLVELKYLERCLLESLRMYPTAFMYFRRLESPLELDENTKIPTGTNVGVYLPGMHYDPKYYPNPERFDPDRFLPENVKDRGQYAFLPFSAGPRNCIGYKFGLNELKVLTGRVLRHFKIETSDTADSVALNSEITLCPTRGYNFILTKRD